MKVFSKEELAQHNGRNNSTIYVAYKGLVYDVSSSELFKGGKHYFHDTGIDLTQDMDAAPHLDDVMNKFPVLGSYNSNVNSTQVEIVKNEEIQSDSSNLELTLLGKVKLNHLTYQFIFKSNNPSLFLNRNKIGSYINLYVNINNIEYKRSYSIANVDNEGNIEFLIQEKTGGKVSEYLIHTLGLNNKIQCKGCFGGVTISDIKNEHLVLVCTDVGVAPIVDILSSIFKINPSIKVTILVGDRYRNESIYHTLFDLLPKFNRNISYIPYLSREKFVNFKSGYVSDYFKTDLVDKNAFYVIVGWNRMTNEVKSLLVSLGIKKESIYVQMYS